MPSSRTGISLAAFPDKDELWGLGSTALRVEASSLRGWPERWPAVDRWAPLPRINETGPSGFWRRLNKRAGVRAAFWPGMQAGGFGKVCVGYWKSSPGDP